VFLEVGSRNEAACALYEACGFESVGERPGYYQTPDGAEDALIMRAALEAQPAAALRE
jgi:ribosomal-protein-alanine N-acetyltransferase